MKIKEVLDLKTKESLFEIYKRVVKNLKPYDKITKEKMKLSIIKEYEDYNNIIEICTTKELKYLKLLIENNNQLSYDLKYEWEIKILEEKLLITMEIEKLTIPEEFYNSVTEAIKNTKWKINKDIDRLNEILIGICKVYGEISAVTLIDIATKITNQKEETLIEHITNNKLFHYYVHITKEYIPSLNQEAQVLIYQNYIEFIEELNEARKQNNYIESHQANIEDYISIFYNDLNLNNKIIKKAYQELKKLPYNDFLLDRIIINILLNEDRTSIYYFIKEMYSNKIKDIDKFIELLNNAMDEMPSAALNGHSHNELKRIQTEKF